MGRPVVVQVGPLVAGNATNIGTSQKAAAAQALVLNGTTTDAVSNNIALAQAVAGAGNLTLNGAAVVAGVGYVPQSNAALPIPRRIYITSAGNDAGVTFTVTGTRYTVGGLPVSVVETVTGANASVVSTTKEFSTVTSVAASGAAAGNVSVGTNGYATLDMARRVLITSGSSDAGITFTITGYDQSMNPRSEVLAGGATTAVSVLDYLVVTSITTSGAAASTVTIGTNGVAASPWVNFDYLGANSQVAIQCDVTGTVSATVQGTLDDPNVGTNSWTTATYQITESGVVWINHPDSALVNLVASVQGNYAYAPRFARVLLNSGTGSVTTTFTQAFLGGK